MSTRGKRFGQVIAGVVVGLGLAEAAFWVRDDGAFPHVAFYVSDDTLGARLQPNASQRIAFGGNPTTTITTNAKGYRGPDWPAPAANQGKSEILVVGDSQVYGLGVEHDATFSSVLATEAKRVVLNGTSSVLYATIGDLVDPDRLPRAFGLFYTINSVCGLIVPLVFGLIGDLFSVSASIAICGILAFATLPLCLLLARALPRMHN